MKPRRCPNKDCDAYPYYGLAPHKHNLKNLKTDSFIGSTELSPKEEWPKNFHPDPEDSALGVYFCPDCSKETK